MNGPEHYRRAEEILLSSVGHAPPAPEDIAVAQVHATLATVFDGSKLPPRTSGSADGDWRPEELNELEKEMLGRAKTGRRVAGEGPLDPNSMRKEGYDRSIRAEVLSHLLAAEQWQVHPKGVWLQGVRIEGQLDLESATLRCPLHLENCYLDNDGPVVLNYATASVLVLTGCRLAGLEASTLVVTRKLDLTGTVFTGPVSLGDANIAGLLSMTGAQLKGADGNGDALIAGGIKVGGSVYLDSADGQGTFTAAGAVRLGGAVITGHFGMRGAHLTHVGKDGNVLTANGKRIGNVQTDGGVVLTVSGTKVGNVLTADGIKVGGSVFLDSADGQGIFTAAGAVRLAGADITGQFSMRGAQLNGADSEGDALIADGIKVGDDVHLESAPGQGTFTAFTAAGAVRFPGADITGVFNMGGAQLTHADGDGYALTAFGVKVDGDVFLGSADEEGPFTAAGAVRLSGADITGKLRMSGARLNGAGDALIADGVKVGADVLLDSAGAQGTFTTAGAVRLANAQIGGSLNLDGADLKAEKIALAAQGIQITRKLVWRPANQVDGRVNLEGGSAAELDDSWTHDRFEQNGYWPQDLWLDGFTYAIRESNKAGVRQRLDWIRGGKRKTRRRDRGKGATTATGRVVTPDPERPAFASGPYEQLMKMYQQAGDDTAARTVAISQRRDQRKLGNLRWYRKLFNWLLYVTIGYGYRTWEALVLLVGLYALVLAATLVALNHHGAIVPVPENAVGIHPTPVAEVCQKDYPCFSPIGYAFDTVVPIINVHQADYWRPDASTSWGAVCTWVSSGGTVVGWLLVTLAVAGYTGLARRVDAS
jgi:hypothetical protein